MSERRRAKPASLLAILSIVASAIAGGPGDGVSAALADARKQPKELRQSLRYLSLYAIPEPSRKEFLQALSFHINSLSRDPDRMSPVQVTPDLVRVNMEDYQWQRNVWEKLASVEPYYHAQIVTKAVEKSIPQYTTERISYDGGRTWQERRTISGYQMEKVEAKTVTAHAPWLPTEDITALALATNSDVPIVRADWFLVQTAQQVDRKGTGYYAFLGFKKRADLEEASGLDVKAAKRLRLEIAALISESGVALDNRQIIRFQALAGGYWFTLDSKTSVGKQNAIRLLDGDFQHDAEEIYAPLPNGMFAFAASDAKGNLQDTVPDNIAGDHSATGNDRRIHPGISCVRCHTEGLRPIDDWARKVYRGPLQLASLDYKKYKRLKQLYLSDLPGQLKLDVDRYEAALKALNGLTAAANAKLYARVWAQYEEKSLSLEETARELGYDKKVWKNALELYGKRADADPVLMGLLADARVRREHWEEIYAKAQEIARGGIK